MIITTKTLVCTVVCALICSLIYAIASLMVINDLVAGQKDLRNQLFYQETVIKILNHKLDNKCK